MHLCCNVQRAVIGSQFSRDMLGPSRYMLGSRRLELAGVLYTYVYRSSLQPSVRLFAPGLWMMFAYIIYIPHIFRSGAQRVQCRANIIHLVRVALAQPRRVKVIWCGWLGEHIVYIVSPLRVAWVVTVNWRCMQDTWECVHVWDYMELLGARCRWIKKFHVYELLWHL